MTLNEQNGFIKNTGTMILSYTVLFAVLIAGVFSTFYLQHKCLMNIYDAYDQGYFWTVELKKNLSSLMAGNGFPEWSWSKGPGMEVKAITDPFMVLAALFPIGHIELGYSVVTILRLYVSGLAFMAFAREVEIARYQAVMGAICYTFSAWIINVSLVQSQFVNITILFPLLIMSVDRVYKGKSSVPFMILVALTMINSVYLAYMAGLSAVLYILLRYFNYCEKFSIKEYVVSVLKFIVYGLIGMAASAVITMTTIQSLMGASTGGGSGKAYDTFAGMSFIFNLGNKFVSEGYDFGYGYIGLPILALMVIAVSYRYFSLRNTQLIMTAIFVIMTPFPFFSSMFNGFGYVTTRWYFMLIFFLVWTATESFDLDRLAEIKNLIIMFIWMAIITVSTLGFAYLDITENYSRNDILFVAGSLAAGYLMLVIIATGIKGKTPLKFRQGAITLITVGAIACLWTISFQGSMDTFVKDNEINAQLEASTQRVGNQIEDDGFYRIDQVDGINIHKQADQPANENLWWGTRTLYLYDSKVPSRLSEFNKLLGNNYGYSKRVYVQSNGNRMGMDFLYGVKYFLGDDTKNGTTGSDQYAGYGFEPYEQIDGVNVFKNKYDSGLGFGYDKVISETEFGKLGRLAREQVVLQAMVLPDETCETIGEEFIANADDMAIDIDDIDYDIVATDRVEFDGNSFSVENFAEEDTKPGFTIHVNGVKDSQMVVSFDNLIRYNLNGVEAGDFLIKARNNKLVAEANNKKNNQTIGGIVDYDLNMGYYNNYDGNIKITITKPGTYTFDKLYVSAMSTENYDKYAQARLESRYEIGEFDSKHVLGTVNAPSDGFMFFSIPSSKNWSVYVDGKKAEKLSKANITFMAVAIDKGIHQIELKHAVQHKQLATCASAVAVLLIIAMGIISIRRRNRQRRN